MFYSFELQMAGVILLTAMAAGGISLWIKRRKAQQEIDKVENEESQNIYCKYSLKLWGTISSYARKRR